jgi:hypothetical protein
MSAFHADDRGSNPRGSIFKKVTIREWELRDFHDRNFFRRLRSDRAVRAVGKNFCSKYFQRKTLVAEAPDRPPPRTEKENGIGDHFSS